ncbi:thiol-disulfide oxidoreductase ResA [Sediminibacillus dalangtanensis]|uniref:Thiol-disulfide oxidoreductase ResA n=1 Tax=Sediminibacillus dalangtanensis TaxID=2729421 RepID=A0ABX7VTV9_9BACI|nr:thiol-disulfide oxidoreductase ResA [Sediminibacillus dalangtanensis]QTM99060.1 thiol-disulfide oxidoreductase ResA [Sediminibacillus dalangtanensis]
MNKKKRRKIMRTSILIILLAAVIFAIYNTQKETEVVEIGDQAPDFVLKTLKGETIQLSDFQGEKGVFLNFWATYCPPCEKEMPYMENQHQYFKNKGVTVLAVDVGEPKITVEGFVRRKDLSFPILLDENGSVMDAYGVGSLPITFLIDKNGKVVNRIPAGMTEEEINEYMNQIRP